MTCCVTPAHLQVPIEFGKDSHSKFAPTPRLSLFFSWSLSWRL